MAAICAAAAAAAVLAHFNRAHCMRIPISNMSAFFAVVFLMLHFGFFHNSFFSLFIGLEHMSDDDDVPQRPYNLSHIQ